MTPSSRALAALLTLLLGAVVAAPAAAQGPTGARRVLLVDLDDVGNDLLADTDTPTLDWIAANGRHMTSFWTSPVCSPSRAQVVLGAYGSHPDVRLGGIVRERSRYVLPAHPLAPLPRVLHAAGKRTVKLGKWHLTGADHASHPLELGFDEYEGVPTNLGTDPRNYYAYFETDGALWRPVVGRYLTTEETDDAIRRVRREVDFVWLSYHAVHRPFHIPPPHLHTISNLTGHRRRARAALQALDAELGRLLAAALPLGYTVLVFSDNGTSDRIGGGKGTLWETGVRTSLWAIGPGIARGEDDALCGSVDLYATVLDLFGVARRPGDGPHSVSLAPRLAGSGPPPRTFSYAERFKPSGHDPHAHPAPFWRRAVRDTRYKLVVDQDVRGEQLFDLDVDPTEATDLLLGTLTPDAASALARLRDVLARL